MTTATAISILLVEDDLRLAELVARYLEGHGYQVTSLARGDEVARQVALVRPDLVILDLGLPGKDGLEVCRSLRPAYTNPILILTARGDDVDQVVGLELGADDYVIKPVEPRVLMARIKALLRRGHGQGHAPANCLTFGALAINLSARAVTHAGRAIALSRLDFDLLVLLASNAGVIQSREMLFKSLYGRDYDGSDRLLDIRMSHLRRKLGEDPVGPQRIKTVWGKGYLFVAEGW